VLSPLAIQPVAAQDQGSFKAKIAVVAFKNPTSWWGGELGESAASQLTTRLVNSGAFVVLERERAKAIFDEWYLNQSGAVAPGTAVDAGKLEGVEYLVTGQLKKFDLKQRGAQVRLFGKSVGGNQTVAESAINVRVISVRTGQVLAAAENDGKKTLDAGGTINGQGYQEVTDKSAWNPTLAEDALGEALDKITVQLVSQKSKFPGSAPAVAAPAPVSIVGQAADGSVYLDQGQNNGIAVGKRFKVLRVVDTIKDAQGNVLDNVSNQVGIVEITKVLPRSAIGKVSEGEAAKADVLEPAN
jgi:curli biogenesis system outer membrane secretion channel CsgG